MRNVINCLAITEHAQLRAGVRACRIHIGCNHSRAMMKPTASRLFSPFSFLHIVVLHAGPPQGQARANRTTEIGTRTHIRTALTKEVRVIKVQRRTAINYSNERAFRPPIEVQPVRAPGQFTAVPRLAATFQVGREGKN